MPSAHPLSPVPDLGAPPLGVAIAGVVIVALVLVYGRFRAVEPAEEAEEAPDPQPGRWSVVTRLLAVVLLGLLVFAGRFGDATEIDNIAPALVLGVAWPLLLLGALCLGRSLWRAVDPWGGVVAAVEWVSGGGPSARLPAYAGLPAALAWTAYLNGYVGSTQPRAVGAALAIYTIAVLAVGIAAGREALRRVEIFGLAADWTGRLRRSGLARWRTPRGAEVVVGALVGGMGFAELRIAPWWNPVAILPRAAWYHVAGALGCALLGAGLAYLLERWATRRGAPGSVAAALVPMIAAYAVATQLRRLLNSVQLVYRLASDPFGREWDLFGTAGAPVNGQLLSVLQLRWTAVAILVLGGVLGAVVLRRRVADRAAQDPAAAALYLSVGLGILGVTTTV